MMCVLYNRGKGKSWDDGFNPQQKRIWKADSPSSYSHNIMREEQTGDFYLTFFSVLPQRQLFFQGTQTFSTLKARGKEEEKANIVTWSSSYVLFKLKDGRTACKSCHIFTCTPDIKLQYYFEKLKDKQIRLPVRTQGQGII